jgi:hypothetical protein
MQLNHVIGDTAGIRTATQMRRVARHKVGVPSTCFEHRATSQLLRDRGSTTCRPPFSSAMRTLRCPARGAGPVSVAYPLCCCHCGRRSCPDPECGCCILDPDMLETGNVDEPAGSTQLRWNRAHFGVCLAGMVCLVVLAHGVSRRRHGASRRLR